MIEDTEFNNRRLDKQKLAAQRYFESLAEATKPNAPRIVVIEVGAGTANPILRDISENVASSGAGFLIRISPGDFESRIPKGVAGVSLRATSLSALKLLDKQIQTGERLLSVEELQEV